MDSEEKRERVLCLARSAALLEQMRKALKAYRLDLLGAFTADQGVAICVSHSIDAAILEANMIRDQAWSVVKTLKMIRPNLPILLLDERQRNRGDMPPEGVDGLANSASMSDLVCKLRLMLENHVE
jgi:DNA-binding response OmpR family regulator